MTTTTLTNTVAERFTLTYTPTVFSRSDILETGVTPAGITQAVRAGTLLRLRRDHYALPALDPRVEEAVRIGERGRGSAPCGTLFRDAVSQAIRCQEPRAAIATLDSVLHHRLMTPTELRQLFAKVPRRLRPLLKLVDGTAESGPETFVRLILRALGVRFRSQVYIPGVGRVDFLVEGWLIIECDSREFHEGWEKQVEDRARDLAAAQRGYITVRPLAVDVLSREHSVRDAIAEVIATLGPRFTPSQLRKKRVRAA